MQDCMHDYYMKCKKCSKICLFLAGILHRIMHDSYKILGMILSMILPEFSAWVKLREGEELGGRGSEQRCGMCACMFYCLLTHK